MRWFRLFLPALLWSQACGAATYYVKNGGNDGLNGQSLANAWATLGHAANVVNPGDTVRVQDGNYQGFYLDRSGTAGNPITFLADGSNVRITADNGTTPDGINVEGVEYAVIDGFIVDNRTRAGIRVAVSQFITVRNCHTGFNGRWGIFSGFADDFTIEFNETHDSQAEHGIYVSNSGDRPIIRGNIVYDNHANGIHMNGDESQGGDGTISDALVEGNVIFGNGVGGGSGINMDGVSDSTVRNNLLYDNHASGISLYRIDAATGAKNNKIINNTIVTASNGRWCININNGSTGNTVRNNILYNYHSFRGAITIDSSSRSGFSSDYNAVIDRFSSDGGNSVDDLSDWQGLGYDLHTFLATPTDLFVNPGTDFHLKAACSAIDAGTATSAPAVDVDGDPRPVGSGFDIGAYEWQLPLCDNGMVNPGEQCGEPGLNCGDPQCSSCQGCTCVPNPVVCGDAVVCGGEQCESDSDCGGGLVCDDCQCVNAPVCDSGIVIQNPRQTVRANPFTLRVSGRAVIPKPWVGVNPLVNGVRVVVDARSGGGVIDATIPGGAFLDGIGWKVNRTGTRWVYTDPAGSIAGIKRVSVSDRSKTEDGRLSWQVRGKGTAVVLPDVNQVRTTVVLGSVAECAAIDWNPPTGLRPRCKGDATRLGCR